MKTNISKQRNRALTIPELLVVSAMLVLLVFIFFPVLFRARIRGGPNCVSNLKQVALSFHIWEGDHDNKYPMAISVTNGGGMESIARGDVLDCFRAMSNELSTPKILICPTDKEHVWATNFASDFHIFHISYFVGADVTNETNPNMLLIGDDNFTIDNSPVKLGLLTIPTSTSVSWSGTRHIHVGNIAFADGSVSEVSSSGLQEALVHSGIATNRLAIP